MEFKQKYDYYLNDLEKYINDNAGNCFNHNSKVGQAAMYSLMAGGKRTRGVLCLAVCDMLSGDMSSAESFACACEMLHCYSLIHDDLPCMDNDDMRRGKPSCHKAYGEATALLAGDALLTGAFEMIASCKASAHQKAQAVLRLSKAGGANGMIYGQELDLASENKTITQQELELVHKNKTGMLISASAILGGIAANATCKEIDALMEYAFYVGLSFQIVDDILDVTSSADELGKPIGSDKDNNKNTFVSLIGIDASRKYIDELTDKACNILKSEFKCDTNFLQEFALMLLHRKK
ncbi:MAG: polyprenyl synthetase family protein [Oscillospiraceae bacterium]